MKTVTFEERAQEIEALRFSQFTYSSNSQYESLKAEIDAENLLQVKRLQWMLAEAIRNYAARTPLPDYLNV